MVGRIIEKSTNAIRLLEYLRPRSKDVLSLLLSVPRTQHQKRIIAILVIQLPVAHSRFPFAGSPLASLFIHARYKKLVPVW